MEDLNKKEGFSRRGFLKTAAAVGAALAVSPALDKVQAATRAVTGSKTASAGDAKAATITAHRTLGTGKAAFEVSALGFGVMGMTYNRSYHPDKKQCIRLLHEAMDRGVTFRGKVNVTTKFGHEVIDGKATGRQDSRPTTIRRYCEESLKRLRTDVIPMFYQHRFDRNTPVEDVAGTITDLIKEGKVLHWGMCEVSAETIRKAHAVCPLTAIQSEYHLMHREVEKNGVLDVCRELGIGFVPYSPMNRGFLGGDLNEYTEFDPHNDNRTTLPAQLALGWLLQKEPWIVPIPGTTKLSHLEENLRTLDFTLSAEEWKQLEDAVAAIPVTGDRYNAEQQKQVGF